MRANAVPCVGIVGGFFDLEPDETADAEARAWVGAPGVLDSTAGDVSAKDEIQL